VGSIDAECDFGSISAGLKPGSKILRPSDRNDRMTPLFKSLRVRIQKKTPKMEFFLDRFKMAGHPVIGSFGHSPNFFGHPRGNRISLEMDGPQLPTTRPLENELLEVAAKGGGRNRLCGRKRAQREGGTGQKRAQKGGVAVPAGRGGRSLGASFSQFFLLRVFCF